MYELSTLLPPSSDNYKQQQQAIFITISSLLKQIESEKATETLQPQLKEALQLLSQCKTILKEIQIEEDNENSDSDLYLVHALLEIACLSYLHSPLVEERVIALLSISDKPVDYYLDLYYLLNHFETSLLQTKTKCLKKALHTQLQSPFSLDKVLEIIHCLLDNAENKQDIYYWNEQLLQIMKDHGEHANLSQM